MNDNEVRLDHPFVSDEVMESQSKVNHYGKNERCVICGARCRGSVKSKGTCSAICHRAFDNNITREQQITKEMNQHAWTVREFLLLQRGFWRNTNPYDGDRAELDDYAGMAELNGG